MKIVPRLSHVRAFHLPVVIIILLLAALAVAAPFHHPTIDGTITADGTDWDPADLVVDDSGDDDLTRSSNVRRLWCTWDQDSLYVAVTYQDLGANEALSVFLDLDRGVGPDNAGILDNFPGNFLMPEGHRFELVLGRLPSEGLGGNPPLSRLVTDDNGTTVSLASQVSAAQGMSSETKTAAGENARLQFWLNAEIALPWSAIYPDQGTTVPPHAIIKAVAVSTVAHADSNGIDSAPDNEGLDRSGPDPVLLANMAPSVIDADGDGQPDPADATISGTVTLPQDPGSTTVTVQAELIDFAGNRDPGAPLSVVTTGEGIRTWTLARLPAGTYRITTSSLGYFQDQTTVQVTQSQVVTGIDRGLIKATTISGFIGFESGPGGKGTVTLEKADGTHVETQEFDFSQTGESYTFFPDEGGDFVVRVDVETYMPDEAVVSVATGEEQANVDFTMVRQTEISGAVSFLEGPGQPGTIYFLDSEGNELDFVGFPLNGGPFQFFTPVGGSFTLSANTNAGEVIGIYAPLAMDVDVTLGQDITGLAVEMSLAAFVTASISFEGPPAEGRLTLTDNNTGVVMLDGAINPVEGDSASIYLGPSEYRLDLEALGYSPRTIVFNVTEADTSLGVLLLSAVRATHLEIINDDGETQPEIRATAYDPADDPWTSSRVLLAARDDEGRDDLYDLDGSLQGFRLSALKMDDLSPPNGNPVFYPTDQEAPVDSVVSFVDGRAEFWMSDTAVEVLRVYLAQPNKAPIAGRIVVAFLDPEPRTVLLTADRDTLVADDMETITVTAQLFDTAENLSLIPDIPVTFSVASGSSGKGQFVIPTVLTNAEGTASASISATGAGLLQITATVVINNRVLDVVAYDLDSGETVLPLYSVAGPTSGWKLSLPSNLSDLVTPVAVNAQTVDDFGNPTADQGRTISLSADPAGLGTFDPIIATSNEFGRASSTYTPSGTAGLVFITGTSGDLAGAETGLRLRDLVVIPDPVWYEEPLTRQTFDKTDLTALVVANTPDELLLEIPFQSDWNGLQLHIAFETNSDAAGASGDPFGMPVNYGHALKPDYVLTTKYSANDYGDFRRWNTGSSSWDFWNPTTGGYEGSGNIQGEWVTKEADRVLIRIPKEPFGGTFPPTILLEAYLTQEDGEKRSAFDSAPQDSTLNLTFDYEDPQPGDWDSTKGPVTLEAWGREYVVRTDFPVPPAVENVSVTPAEMDAGATLILEALITESVNGIGDVVADLSAMGGSSLARMYDDGDAGHGDSVAGDGVYSLLTLVPISNPGGAQDLIVNAFDGENIWANTGIATINVTALVTPIIVATDPVGDDHGPNQPGVRRKFYTYPTNIAFVQGGFDLTGLTVFETKANVGGELIDMIAFQVSMGDFPDPADPGTANWNPLYADLNITKIDILIDNAPGGSISSLPWRQAAFQPWDAWDWAIIMDGWYKALIPSLGQNTVDSWRDNALRNDKNILLLSDPDLDTVTALVSKSALGDPTPEDIAKWDIAVCMASHDFGGEEVLGGVRWVEEARSEWQFGGGQSGDRDSNYMDLLLVAGAGTVAEPEEFKTQEEILDYDSPDALARMERGMTPVAIEMTPFKDSGPPVIDPGGDGSVVTKVAPILDTPLAMAINISDDNRVAEATFRYRSTGFEEEGWQREVPMGFLGRDAWVVDILPSWLDSNLVYSPIDSTRYLEFEVEASDPGDPNADPPVAPKTSISPVTTLQIEKNAICRPRDSDLDFGDLLLIQVEGALLNVPDKLRRDLVRRHIAEVWTGGQVNPDTMGADIELQWDVCNIAEEIRNAPRIPDGRPIGVFRQVYIATSDTLGGYLDYGGPLPGNAQLSLHYPQEWVPEGIDENLIALYQYNSESDRWIKVGGNVTPTGNNVTATINQVGTFGLFVTEANSHDSGEVISGITISPNPFSPNGDGLYDDTNISFFLTQEATITVEVYNIYGDRKNILAQTFPFSGSDLTDPVPRRVPGLIWDGTESNGKPVPYGIYILRVLATYNFGGGTRTVRSNHPVAVIR
ncbi:MAG: glucodextranase DOMON-like domain-containing protein [Candidatus Krumholzibacteriota bacterium]